jgi:hypothetical protein
MIQRIDQEAEFLSVLFGFFAENSVSLLFQNLDFKPNEEGIFALTASLKNKLDSYSSAVALRVKSNLEWAVGMAASASRAHPTDIESGIDYVNSMLDPISGEISHAGHCFALEVDGIFRRAVLNLSNRPVNQNLAQKIILSAKKEAKNKLDSYKASFGGHVFEYTQSAISRTYNDFMLAQATKLGHDTIAIGEDTNYNINEFKDLYYSGEVEYPNLIQRTYVSG